MIQFIVRYHSTGMEGTASLSELLLLKKWGMAELLQTIFLPEKKSLP